MRRWRLEPRLLVACCCLAGAAHAGTPWPNAEFGSSEADLRGALPGLERAHRPALGPRGERGLWTLPPTPMAGLTFLTTFYFKSGHLQRIEQLHTGSASDCSPTGAVAASTASAGGLSAWLTTMRQRYGPEVAANDPLYGGAGRQSAAWIDGDTDVTADWAATPAGCQIRVAYKPRVLKDASEL